MWSYPAYDGEPAPMTRDRFFVYRGDDTSAPCKSRSGRRRMKHEPDKDGKCVYCDKRTKARA